MRMKLATVAAMVALWGAGMVYAEDAAASKEVTLKGRLQCSKCEMKATDRCMNAIKVSEDGKDVVYYIADNAVSKATHHKVCAKPMDNVTVVGTVADKDGKKYIDPTKIETPAAEKKTD